MNFWQKFHSCFFPCPSVQNTCLCDTILHKFNKGVIIGKKKLAVIFCILLVVLAGCGSSSGKLRFGAAALGGAYHSFGEALVKLVNTDSEKYDMEVKTTAGSAANVRLLSDDYVQMAIAQADMINDAYYGEGAYKEQKYDGYSAVAALYTEACQVVVRDDSGITTIDDLQGKKVSVGEEESGTEQNAQQILSVYGLGSGLVETVNLDYSGAAQALQDGKIDAFFCTAGVQTTVIDELSKQCDIRVLSIDKKNRDKLMKGYKFYTEYEIPAETYQGQDEPVETVGVKAVLLAGNKVSADTVENITKLLFENKQELQYSLPVDITLDEKTATEGITIPFHEGAVKYYESCRVDVKTEKGGQSESK